MGVTYNYGAGPTYTKIASQTLGSAAASVTFTGIPQNFTDLIIVANVQGQSNGCNIEIWFNGDGSSSNYSSTTTYFSGTSALSTRNSNIARLNFGTNGGQPFANANQFATNIYNIQNYANTTTYKTTLGTTRSPTGGYTGAGELDQSVGLWRSTAAITSINIGVDNSKTMQIGSTFTIYGVAAALKPKAFGGTVTFDPATSKWVHTFTSSGVFTPTQRITTDYLVVAGGGGGGQDDGGGGGAGGLRSTVTATGRGGSLETAVELNPGTVYTITIGGGGSAGTVGSGVTNGVDSSISGTGLTTITSTGGGRGGGLRNVGGSETGFNGGSGGGARDGAGGTGTTGQGYDGGTGIRGGGGGGAGANGANGTNPPDRGGDGGNGVAVSITGSSVTYAGGGGGGNSGVGGTGGGGDAHDASTGNGTAGGTNTGGGGGGGQGNSGSPLIGTAGGSGIVIVRYSA